MLVIAAGAQTFFDFEGPNRPLTPDKNRSGSDADQGGPGTAGAFFTDASDEMPVPPSFESLLPLTDSVASDTSKRVLQARRADTSKPINLHGAVIPPRDTSSLRTEKSNKPQTVEAARDTVSGSNKVRPPAVADSSRRATSSGATIKPMNKNPAANPKNLVHALPQTDTTVARQDTTMLDTLGLDTLKLSAWLQGLRREQPQAPIFAPYHYPLFLYASGIQHTATIDSAGKYVDVREILLGRNIRIPIRVPLEEYIKLSEQHSIQTTWESLAHQYSLGQRANELGNLMSGITNISIPIPSNPVLSIFGPPRINLKISGAVDIHGAWQNQKVNAQSLSQLGNVTNAPNFNQDVNINVNGTVGDKLSIGANWDTQNQFDYENQLHLTYTGYSDEIIKKVEAGNVSMSTPNSFIGGSQALFGIKSQMQFGPVTVTALASQQKAQSQTLTLSGGSSSQPISLHAYQYDQNHFIVDTSYIQTYLTYLQSRGTRYSGSAASTITYAEVYVSQPQTSSNPNLRFGDAVMDLQPLNQDPGQYDSLKTQGQTIQTIPGQLETGWFQALPSSQYNMNYRTGVLTLLTSLNSNQVLAVAYSTQGGAQGPDTLGTFASQNTNKNVPLILKLVKPANLIPSETEAWEMMLKNYYQVGGPGLDSSSLQNLQVVYQAPGTQPQPTLDGINLNELFGISVFGPGGSGPATGAMNFMPGVDIDVTTGDLIFPYLDPFVDAFNNKVNGQGVSDPTSYEYQSVYDTTTEAAQNDASHDRFLITGQSSSGMSATRQLGFNLVQGSVKVLLNGQPLTPDVDYSVDYLTGELTIKDPAALLPSANVQIQYQTNDIFQVASKSLVGLRADYNINDQTDLGFTMMSYTINSPTNHVQIGQEPFSNLILGVDGGTSLSLPFLTRALDALPLISTTAPSILSVHGEAAYMLPNPNTQTSPIPGDNNQGIAFIDDFQGAKRTIPLPINFSSWYMASPPAVSALDSLHPYVDATNAAHPPGWLKNYYKGWIYWYNVTPSGVSPQIIWPKQPQQASQTDQPVMNIGFLPMVRGEFNRAPSVQDTLAANPRVNWGGLMTVLSTTSTDLSSQNISYIEVWMKIDSGQGVGGKMHIDIGQVNEDVIGDRTLHTEDPLGTGTLISDTLDYGLDGMMDPVERQQPWAPGIISDPDRPWCAPNYTYDPDGDDYEFAGANLTLDTTYFRINGTEGNAQSPYGKLPDTEDLLHQGTLQQTDSYYEYTVKLDTTRNPFIVGGGSNGWYQYLIPLQDYERAVNNPSLSNVQFVRLWFNGMPAGGKGYGTGNDLLIRIAEINLVGNYWKPPDPQDTTMQVSTVSVFDTPGYEPPVAALAPVDNSNPSGPVQLNEHSLDLILNGLRDGESRFVYKTVPQPLNVFNYREMKVFVHGDLRFNYVDSTNYDAAFFIRFGSDSSDYYQYEQPIRPGWQDLPIEFAALTAIKEKRDSATAYVPPQPADNGIPGSTYWITGNPSLQSISYFQMGIINPKNIGTPLPLYGNVWVDALRVTNANNTPGWAYQFNASLQLADVGSIAFNYSTVNPFFHGLTTQFGNLNTTRNWGINASFNLDRLFPREWTGTSIPFTYSHTESFSNPLYLPNSDILVSQAVSQRTDYLKQFMPPDSAARLADSLLVSSQVLTVTDQWAIPSMRIVFPSNKWYIRDIIDNITMGFNWSGSSSRNPQTEMATQWGWNYNAGYSVQFDPMAYYTPFPSKNKGPLEPNNAFQIRYLPNSLSLSMAASRSLSVQELRTQLKPIVTPNFTAQRSGSINWKLTNNGILNPTLTYNFSVGSTLLYLDADTANGSFFPRPDSYVFRQIFLNGGLIDFGQDYNFSENFSLTTQPHLPFSMDRFLNLQSSYSSAYSWVNSIQQGSLGKAAGYNASLQLGGTLQLKTLANQLFSFTTANASTPSQQPTPTRRPPRRRGREEFSMPDTTQSPEGNSPVAKAFNFLVKVPFLDFDNISLTYSEANSAQNGGLPTFRPGMGNFFRFPFIEQSNPDLGPSQLYQLGLVSDPYSTLNTYRKSGFPFIGFSTIPTARVADASITDNYTNSNTLDLRTSRNLWQGAVINLSWHVNWSYNRNTTYTTDGNGNPIANTESESISGQFTKSFFTLPGFPILSSIFKSGINQVAADYQQLQAGNPNNSAANLSQAFVQGFETLPILDKIFGPLAPRLNYSFHWDGLEQLPLFKSFASHVSFDNSYQSTYTESWNQTGNQAQVINGQNISYGFQPLAGLNVTFKNFGNATISASVLYNTSSQYNLTPTNGTIAQSYTGQLSITADYSKQGFSIPLFGLNLQNNVDISASYSNSKTDQVSYTVTTGNATPTPLSGTAQTSIEIQFKYDLSQRVSASIYYQNTKVQPTAPGELVPGTTTNEVGVNVHVSIAG